jgi:type IV pilus assembly protein PilA
MKKTYLQKGFTLIELLVVIAIIGILSSVILASLNRARDKGADAAIKANLAGIKAQAGIIYDNTLSFATVCSETTVQAALTAAKTAGGITNLNTDNGVAGAADTVTCHSGTAGWAVESPIKSDPTTFFCTDYTGIGTTTVGSTIGDTTDVDCG